MNDTLIKFKRHASRASFHFASENTREWDLGYQDQNNALKIFDDNPDMQDEMREMAKDELWGLSSKRPLGE